MRKTTVADPTLVDPKESGTHTRFPLFHFLRNMQIISWQREWENQRQREKEKPLSGGFKQHLQIISRG